MQHEYRTFKEHRTVVLDHPIPRNVNEGWEWTAAQFVVCEVRVDLYVMKGIWFDLDHCNSKASPSSCDRLTVVM